MRGPYNLVSIELGWKENPSCKEIRLAYAVIVNGSFIRDPLSVRPILTWISLGRHRIVGPGLDRMRISL